VSRTFDEIAEIDAKCFKLSHVPVGSVEFTREYAKHIGINLPEEGLHYDFLEPYMAREIRRGMLSEAGDEEFVKPVRTKRFTGAIKKDLASTDSVAENTLVWISEPVRFESEFRFYVHDFVNGPQVLGWSRYDDTDFNNPEPDHFLVREVSKLLHEMVGPSAYSVDIGWRSDLRGYSLVEINDGWSLGLYENRDPQSNPPSRRDYAEMLISRWRQILFCSLDFNLPQGG